MMKDSSCCQLPKLTFINAVPHAAKHEIHEWCAKIAGWICKTYDDIETRINMSTFAAMILARYDCNGTAIASIDDLTLILQEMEKALTGSGLPDHDSQVHAEFSNVEGVYLFISKGIHELIMTQKNKNHVPSKE